MRKRAYAERMTGIGELVAEMHRLERLTRPCATEHGWIYDLVFGGPLTRLAREIWDEEQKRQKARRYRRLASLSVMAAVTVSLIVLRRKRKEGP